MSRIENNLNLLILKELGDVGDLVDYKPSTENKLSYQWLDFNLIYNSINNSVDDLFDQLYIYQDHVHLCNAILNRLTQIPKDDVGRSVADRLLDFLIENASITPLTYPHLQYFNWNLDNLIRAHKPFRSDSAFLLRVLISAIGFNDLENLLSHPIPEILDKHVQFFYKVHIESSIKYKEHADIDALYLSTLSFILSHCKSDWCEYLTTHLNTNTLHLIDSLTILTQNNKVDISDTLDHLKEYILHSTTHNDAIIASLSRCLLTLFKFSGDDALLVSTIHTLLNHLSFSTTALITHLTLQLNRSQITNLSTSIFLQNLDTYPKSADIAHHLIALAPITPHSTFIEIAKAIAHLDDSFNAQKAMAKQSLSDKYLSSAVLEHYLKLFIQASQNNSNKVSLGEYVDVIAILMRDDDNHAESDSISAKLRKFWIIVATQSLPDSNALHEIALKSPALVFTQADITAHSAINEKRAFLTTILPRNAGDIRYLSSDQVVLLITLYKLEGIRCAHCRPSTLLAYLDGDIFSDASSTECLKGISDLLTHTFISEWIAQSKVQSIDLRLLEHIKALLIASCHRLEIVRTIAFRFADRVLTAIPDLVSKSVVIYTVLELLSLLHQSCANHMEFEYSFRFNYASSLAAFQIDLPDSSAVKNGLVERLSRALDRWIVSALPGSNLELNSTLSSYLDETNEASPTHYGASLALRYSLKIPPNDSHLASKSQLDEDLAGAFANRFGLRCKTNGEITGVRLALKKGVNEMHKIPDNEISKEDVRRLKKQTQDLLYGIYNKECDLTLPDLKRLLWRCAGILIASNKLDFELLHFLVSVPFQVFTGDSISIALEVWTWLFHERVDFQTKIIMEISSQWLGTIKARKGLFSPSEMDPFHAGIEYSPSNEEELNSHCISIKKTFLPHLYVIHLINGLLTTVESNDPIAIVTVSKCLHRSMQSGLMSRHPLSREVRFTILNTAFRLLKSSSLDETSEAMMRESTLHCALAWFDLKPQWCFGGNKLQLKSDMQCLEMFLHNVKTDGRIQSHSNSTHNNKMKLLELLLDNEISKLKVWLDPLNESDRGGYLPTLIQGTTITEFEWHRHVHTAWSHSPELLMGLASRFKSPTISREVKKLTRKHTNCFVNVSESLEYLLDGGVHEVSPSSLRLLNFWAPVSPSVALTYFQPEYRNHSIVLQYAMKCLEHHSVDLTFFYVPQIVQALRDDKLGYVERFIFETAKISQLFCHQIIWNMKANTHRDDNGELEDPMKPLLERMINMIVSSLSGDAKEFFEREFSFFDSVTSISGKLKPFVKKSKPEKKSKIDEEMQRIDVDPGVYLPSNPDGVVVDIDKVSGRPLQSHAKAPFMATFKVRKEFVNLQSPDGILDTEQEEKKQVLEKWQAAIFKVGDDCRQDVLALQAIAIFKTIFSSAGIALYLNPYRVTATGPGCGVIDVVPNATSRDEMGRAKVNDLAIYFLQTFGSKESLAYQKSRLNFIRSMAAYSLICYILQVKDRHNGNIMIDGEGHIVHIDFGFLFDIGPGGIKFEPNSFKLSHEMVTVMGGRDSDGYKMFQELIIKGFIAARIYAHEIVNVVKLMLGTELPSFKGEGTIYRLRERFMLHLDDRAASTYMLGVIRNAHENSRSIAYDEFQRITNDIPYAL